MFAPHMFGCLLYIHNTKKACFVRLRGCPYAPIHFDAPICLDGPLYVWMPPICLPVCLDIPHMFGCPCIVGHLLCLDDPCMLGHPHMLSCPPYVWMMFGCPLYIHNTKKGCFVRLRRCPYAPIHFDAPICLDGPLYVWIPPVCLDASHMFGHPHIFGCPPVCLDTPHVCTPHMFGCPLYVWVPPIWTPLNMVGCPHMFGKPLYVWMPSICLAGPLYIWMPPICLDTLISLDAHLYVWTPPLFALPICLDAPCMFGCPLFGHPSIWLDAPHDWKPPVCLDVLHMFGCPPICLDAAKCMVASKGRRDIQTYGGCPNIQEPYKHMGYPT